MKLTFKVKEIFAYWYRAIYTFAHTVDFMLSENRDKSNAIVFFKQAIDNNVLTEQIVIDERSAKNAGIENIPPKLAFRVLKWPIGFAQKHLKIIA